MSELANMDIPFLWITAHNAINWDKVARLEVISMKPPIVHVTLIVADGDGSCVHVQGVTGEAAQELIDTMADFVKPQPISHPQVT